MKEKIKYTFYISHESHVFVTLLNTSNCILRANVLASCWSEQENKNMKVTFFSIVPVYYPHSETKGSGLENHLSVAAN